MTDVVQGGPGVQKGPARWAFFGHEVAGDGVKFKKVDETLKPVVPYETYDQMSTDKRRRQLGLDFGAHYRRK